MKRQIIGKIQLIIGILLLIGGIIGLVLDYREFQNEQRNIMEEITDARNYVNTSYSDETNLLIKGIAMNSIFSVNSFIMQMIIGGGIVLILTIMLSILFITQGLANLSKD